MKPTPDATVTQEFGVAGPYWQAGYHTGRDYRATVGAPVLATWRGQVKTLGNNSSYGLYVAVVSSSAAWPTAVRHMYCHLSSFAVRDEQWVNPGSVLGKAGDSGNVTAAHLHYEERVPPFGYYDHRRPVLDSIGWKVLDLSKLVESFRREPDSSLALYPDNTRVMQEALRHQGLWYAATLSGKVTAALRDAYGEWEVAQGWDATGIPTTEGVRRLGLRWGFTVTA